MRAVGMLLLFLAVIVLVSTMFVVRRKRRCGLETFTPDWERSWTLALVHSEGCPHCHVAREVYGQVAANLRASGKLDACRFQVLDAAMTEAGVINKDTLRMLGNPGFVPHLVLRSPSGELLSYNGPYTYEAVVRWIVSYGPNCSLGSSLFVAQSNAS